MEDPNYVRTNSVPVPEAPGGAPTCGQPTPPPADDAHVAPGSGLFSDPTKKAQAPRCPKCGCEMGPQTVPADGSWWCPSVKCDGNAGVAVIGEAVIAYCAKCNTYDSSNPPTCAACGNPTVGHGVESNSDKLASLVLLADSEIHGFARWRKQITDLATEIVRASPKKQGDRRVIQSAIAVAKYWNDFGPDFEMEESVAKLVSALTEYLADCAAEAARP